MKKLIAVLQEYLKRVPLSVIILVFSFMISNRAQAQSSKSFNPATAEKEIAMQLRAYENALKNGDTAALGNLYCTDAELMQHGSPSIFGRGDIVKEFVPMIHDSITVSGFKTIGLWGNADLLVEEGTGYFAHTNGKVVSRGKYLLVWKKENDEWKIFKDTFFSDGSLKK